MKSLLLALTLGVMTARSYAQIQITNEFGEPIAGAEVLIGYELDNPFPNNRRVTDANGQIALPADWQSPLPITIEAADYLRTTFMDVGPAQHHFQLHRQDNRLEVKGVAKNFGDLKKDGKVDLAMVFPALSRRQLLQLDASTMISPESDQMRVITETMSVPSNVSIPEQKENYIIPVTLKKPEYRMFVKQPGTYRMTAAHGQFPFKTVVDEVRGGKSFFDVLNHFTFIGAGQRDIQVTKSLTGQDLPVNQIPFNGTTIVKGPAFGADRVLVSMTLVEDQGLFFPTDLKRLQPNATTPLRIPRSRGNAYVASMLLSKSEADRIGDTFLTELGLANKPGDILRVLTAGLHTFLRTADEGGYSLAFHEVGASVLVPEFIPLVAKPKWQGQTLTLSVPAAPQGIVPVATYVILSAADPSKGTEKRLRLWEIFADGWVSQINLPPVVPVRAGAGQRWEVLFLGRQADKEPAQDGYFLDDVTYISRNTLDL